MDKEQYLTSYIKNKQSKQKQTKQTKQTKTNKANKNKQSKQKQTKRYWKADLYKEFIYPPFFIEIALWNILIYIIFMSTIRGSCNMKQTGHW